MSHPTNASSYVLPTKPIVGVRGEFGSRQTSSVSPIAATPTSAITDGHQRTYLNATAWMTEARAQQGQTMTTNRYGTRTYEDALIGWLTLNPPPPSPMPPPPPYPPWRFFGDDAFALAPDFAGFESDAQE